VEPTWRIDKSNTVLQVPPDEWRFQRGDWKGVEAHLGIGLPAEYKELVGDGRALVFDDELFIASPFDSDPLWNLLRVHSEAAWALASMRNAFPDSFSVAIFPEPGGVLAWGTDGSAGTYFYDTSDWTVFVSGRGVDEEPGLRYPVGLRGYLDGLKDGSIESATIDEWPAQDAELRRRPRRGA
jgi:hypothetical protein